MLRNGVLEAQVNLDERHFSAYCRLRESFQTYFKQFIPGPVLGDILPMFVVDAHNSIKECRLIPSTILLENGLHFILRASQSSTVATPQLTNLRPPDSIHFEAETIRAVSELSGGQQALLGLAFVFACALDKLSPVYLLDEVDAALDEKNQATVAVAINAIFTSRLELHERFLPQVISVSHNPKFQLQAKHRIQTLMRDGVTETVKIS
jgi:ABC-type lipoprotein export system ATPase subunit